MAQTAMTVRLDSVQKAKFDQLCEQFGMSANTAINIFVRTVIRSRSIPFTISAEPDESIRDNALRAFQHIRREAESRPGPKITLEDINAEINAVREAQREKL
ncbi:MAG: type II toxin-antitoxin system RelB/DinJ family antitoxin [Prevotella sp.]